MATQNWFESGYTGADREQEKRDLGGGPKRWWMAAATTKQVVFIDDEPICFDEHSWKVEGSKFPSSATCISKICQDGCPACNSKPVGKPDYMGHLTIVDCTGYTTRDGKEVKFELVEFCPKLKAMNKLNLKKKNKGSLIGQLYSITRADADSPNTGDDFDHQRAAELDKLYKVVTYRGKNLSEMITTANGTGEAAQKMRKFLVHQFQVPETGAIPEEIPAFNYMKLHEPLEPADLRRQIVGAVSFGSKFSSGSGSTSGGSGGSSSDDVPFVNSSIDFEPSAINRLFIRNV